MREQWRLLLIATALGMLLPQKGWADSGMGSGAGPPTAAAQSPARLFGFGKQVAGIAGGYALGFRIGETTGELGDVEMIYVAPRWGIGISDPMGGDAWYRGHFELVIEGALLFLTEPNDGFGGGITAMVRYNFLPEGRFIPFVEGGGGVLSIDFDLNSRRRPEAEQRGQSDGFNFSLQFGLGFHFFVAERTALTGEARYYHISNRDIKLPNDGIDGPLFMIGVSVFLD